MRAGGCTVQQALTVEAANVVKQAQLLAIRRGHAQVTPLHVANTMLSTSNGLLRTACLQSHSHPLQCKALELCFNVALNRLPAASSSAGPMFGTTTTHNSQQQHPTISNALVAAFKRAQAHQRRGSIENQQQPLLAVKIELEQLIISILDDPSVSRVMREAGFSSTQVKSNVEQTVSLELCSQSSQAPSPRNNNNNVVVLSKQPCSNDGAVIKASKPSTTTPPDHPPAYKDEDVAFVLESLTNHARVRRSAVIVGECLSSLEGVVGGIMDKVEKGDVVEGLREVKFISVSLSTFGNLQREEVEQKIGELTCLVRSLMGKGAVLYLGDLKWIIDYRANSSSSTTTTSGSGHEKLQGITTSYYCPVEHMIMELGRLVYGMGENGRLWLMGIATFQTYMRCRSGQQYSLQTLWGLHPITLPAASLDLTLNTESAGSKIESRSNKMAESSSCLQPLFGSNICSAKLETIQNRVSNSSEVSMSSSGLPSWLKEESKKLKSNDPAQDQLSQKRNPNSFERNLTFSSSSSPSSTTSFFSYDHHQQQHHNMDSSDGAWQMFDANKQLWRRDGPKQAISPIATTCSTPNSASSSDLMEMDNYNYTSRFKEFNAENLNILCNALEQKVPWQKDVVPDVAGTILQCRSGMLKRKGNMVHCDNEVKEETWLFFQGVDVEAKEKIARELAKVVFGSYSNFVTIALSSFSSTRADSTEDCLRISRSTKRLRDEQSCSSYIGRLAQEISLNPHRVFLLEDVEQADFHSQMGIKKVIERGKIRNINAASASTGHEEVSLCDAIIILSCESFSSRSRACSPPAKQKMEEEKGICGPFCLSLDLNICINEDDQKVEEDAQSIDDIGILENVDARIIFKNSITMHEELI